MTDMTDMTFEAFATAALAEGFDEVTRRQWPGGQVVDEHAHPFGVRALVVQGEMWLTAGAESRHLVPGDVFVLSPGALHAERYGPDGATYWAARRSAPTA